MGTPAPMPSGLVLFGLSLGVLLVFVLLLWLINTLKDRPWERAHMSSAPAKPSPESERPNQSRDQSAPSGLSAQPARGLEVAASGLNSATPGLDAEDDDPPWELPRISRF